MTESISIRVDELSSVIVSLISDTTLFFNCKLSNCFNTKLKASFSLSSALFTISLIESMHSINWCIHP